MENSPVAEAAEAGLLPRVPASGEPEVEGDNAASETSDGSITTDISYVEGAWQCDAWTNRARALHEAYAWHRG